jgi:hypothetical protein
LNALRRNLSIPLLKQFSIDARATTDNDYNRLSTLQRRGAAVYGGQSSTTGRLDHYTVIVGKTEAGVDRRTVTHFPRDYWMMSRPFKCLGSDRSRTKRYRY